MLGKAEPPDVDGHTELPRPHARGGAQYRPAAVAGYCQVRLELSSFSCGGAIFDTGDAVAGSQEPSHLGAAEQGEGGLGGRGTGQHLQEVPLGCHRDVFVRSRKSVEIAQAICLLPEVDGDLLDQVVGHGRELRAEPQFIQQI